MFTSTCATSKKAYPGKEKRFGSPLVFVPHVDSRLTNDDASPGLDVAPDAGKAELLIRCSGLNSLLWPETHACQQGIGADM
jgi:hypothetical protein